MWVTKVASDWRGQEVNALAFKAVKDLIYCDGSVVFQERLLLRNKQTDAAV